MRKVYYILGISLIVSLLTDIILSIVLDPSHEDKVLGIIVVGLWLFSILPAFRYAYLAVKRQLQNASFGGPIFFLFLLEIYVVIVFIFAPAFMIVYYINVMKYKEY